MHKYSFYCERAAFFRRRRVPDRYLRRPRGRAEAGVRNLRGVPGPGHRLRVHAARLRPQLRRVRTRATTVFLIVRSVFWGALSLKGLQYIALRALPPVSRDRDGV